MMLNITISERPLPPTLHSKGQVYISDLYSGINLNGGER